LLPAGLSAVTDAAGHYALRSAPSSLRAPAPRGLPGAFLRAGAFPWRAGGRDANGRNLHVSHAPGYPWRAPGPDPEADRPAPAKAAAGGDTLDVLAVGWQREARAVASLSGTQDFRLKALAYSSVPYRTGNLDAYTQRMCTLDVHVPAGTRKTWPVIVHLHGGGLQEGDSQEGWSAANMNNAIRRIWEQGYLLICPNYRLGIDPDLPNGGAPRGKYPDYLRDAAAAVAWARRNAPAYGGDTANFYVMGYSAGAWLSLMLAVDSTWYREIGFDGRSVNGYVCLSAQTYTYGEYGIEFNISDRGISKGAALNYVHRMDTPIRLFAGGLETQRIADDDDFMKAMNAVGATNLDFLVMPGRDHQHLLSTIGDANDATRAKILEFLEKYTSKK
jgi:acetyl esterase/lipase